MLKHNKEARVLSQNKINLKKKLNLLAEKNKTQFIQDNGKEEMKKSSLPENLVTVPLIIGLI